eukprot:TRINITY_DN1760_c0_g1_i1.p1 TRINITY_DN1760_c0_g1~~TRINITY_DN1760_c0_g1_i1.p1  ORF type:complete len:187 (-),score=48.03 TRINITY_DN1760_c0_g1_i1:366-926(-)
MLSNDLDAKATYALLNGVSQRLFFKNSEITHELLIEQIFAASSLSAEGKLQHIHDVEGFLKTLAYENPAVGALEAKLKQVGLNEDQSQAYLRFWRLQQQKIHESIRDQAVFNDRLSKMNWRIDIKSKSKHISDLHQPTALVEFTITDSLTGKPKAVKFEMDKDTVTNLRLQIDSIQSILNARSEQS